MNKIPTEGEAFGRYVIESQLGAGGMGVVHLALDTQLHRRVALKLVSAQLADNEEFLARFNREAETLARLDSPHIVTIFDHGDVDGVPYLAMQYVTGGDLGKQLRQRGPVPITLAAQICAQVAEALRDAHAAGVVHRDVKPANVLLRDPKAAEPFVYLVDFGIARSQRADGELTTPGTVAGSWAYLAPERTRGEPASPASDIYALGCLLYACVTGRAPYAGSDVEMALAHVQLPVPQLPAADGQPDARVGELNRILAQAMAKEPGERYASASDFRNDLVDLARRSSSPVGPVGAVAPLGAVAPGGVAGGDRGPVSGAGQTSTRGNANGSKRRAGLAAAAAALVVAAAVGVAFVAGAFDGDGDGGGDNGGRGDESAVAQSGPEAIEDPVPGDWDGDGLGDARVTRSVWRDGDQALPSLILKSDGTAFDAAEEDAGGMERPFAADVDGDGRPDLVDVVSHDDTRVDVTTWRNLGDGFDEQSKQTFGWRTDYGFYGAGDFDGDGLDDLLLTRNRAEQFMEVAVARSNGDGFDEPVVFTDRGGRANEDDLFAIGDFDGDGLDDIAARVANEGKTIGVRLRVLLSTGSTFRKTPNTFVEDARYAVADYIAADVDGDGSDELVHLITDRWGEDEYGVTLAVQRFVNGQLATPEEMVEPTDGGPNIPFLEIGSADVDGDGDEDVLRMNPYDTKPRTARLDVFVSDGDSFKEPAAWGDAPCTTKDCESETAYLVGSQ